MKKKSWTLFCLFCFLFKSVLGNLNVFISQTEVKKLLGLDKELFYVRDGTINKYALGFVVPVPSEVEALHFSWFSLEDISPLHYSITASSSHPVALHHPNINISWTGMVPFQAEVWRLSMKCTGEEAAEVIVTLQIAITGQQLPASKITNLKLRRKKICRSSQSTGLVKEKEKEGVPAFVIFFVAVGGCLTLIVIIIILVFVAWMRSAKNEDTQHKTTRYTSLPNANNGPTPSIMSSDPRKQVAPQVYLPGVEVNRDQVTTAGITNDSDFRISEWVVSLGHEDDVGVEAESIEKLAVERQSLVLGDLLNEGTFGRVYQGCLTRPGCEPQDVMVKTIAPGSSEAQARFLIQEGGMLYPLTHKHLVSLMATTYDGTSPMMIYPYWCPGNLKKWLLSCHQAVSTHQSVCMGLELLTAIRHIHKTNIIHKDVAARNCFVTPTFSIKLCDPALSRDLFPNDYHCLGDNENRPVKWMAMESINSGHFSRASDVWSWGVTLWEILTRSQQPFPDIDPFEMESYLAEGFRLHQPVNCPDQLYTVMVSCWAHIPHHRATVQTVYNHLMDFSTQLQQFV